jgi:ribose transport system ATP-binding protein
MSEGQTLLETRSLRKAYGENVVLQDLSLTIRKNEILGLAGENGAGKSTLLKILSGVITDYQGEVFLAGERMRFKDPHHAAVSGINCVYQDPALVPCLPVYANMALAHEDLFSRHGVLSKKRMVAAAQEQLEELGLHIDVTRETGSLDVATRQTIEIARACHIALVRGAECPLILLDEPTASLGHHEIAPFFELLSQLRKRASILFISHRLSEAIEVCDRICVLRDGAVTGVADAGELDVDRLHQLMVGREREKDYYKDRQMTVPDTTRALTVTDLSHAGEFDEVSFSVGAGEILSVVGVLGSGKHALGECLVGLRDVSHGSVALEGLDTTSLNYRAHLERGFCYVPGDRQKYGLLGALSGRANITISSIEDMYSVWAVLRIAKEKRRALASYAEMRVKPSNIETQVRFLSGGNQQKVLLARALDRAPTVLVVDNPTAAVDAGVKEELYVVFRELAAAGCIVVLITDDLLEAIHVGNRVAIMKDGGLAAVVDAPSEAKPDEATILKFMV